MTTQRMDEFEKRLEKMSLRIAPKLAAMTDVREVRAFLLIEIGKVADKFPEMAGPRLVPSKTMRCASKARSRNSE